MIHDGASGDFAGGARHGSSYGDGASTIRYKRLVDAARILHGRVPVHRGRRREDLGRRQGARHRLTPDVCYLTPDA